MGQYLEVFTFQLWTLSKFGICLTSIGGGLALEKTGKKKLSEGRTPLGVWEEVGPADTKDAC